MRGKPIQPISGEDGASLTAVSLSTSATRQAFCKSGIRNAAEDDIGAFGITHAGRRNRS
jgi:hypothetical protein